MDYGDYGEITAKEQRRNDRRERRRQRIEAFRNRKVPIRALIPNIATLLGLCAGLTAIRMAIESRYELALFLIVLAALIDGVDGRLARMLKAQSRFGAELDSLADFVNFGVAPAIVIFTWALGGTRSFGWIVVMIFAVACGLRLARFNAALDTEKPRWQSNYFTGIPAPAGAITALLPLYADGIGFAGFEFRAMPLLIVVYTLGIAFLMVSTIPTFSGKLASERVGHEYVPLVFVLVALLAALLFTYPFATMAVVTVVYLAMIPISVRRFQWHKTQDAVRDAAAGGTVVAGPPVAVRPEAPVVEEPAGDAPVADQTRH